MRAALAEAHSELAQRNSFPPELKQWLQISYDREKTFINERKKRALEEMEIAKEGVRKKNKRIIRIFFITVSKTEQETRIVLRNVSSRPRSSIRNHRQENNQSKVGLPYLIMTLSVST